MVVDRDPRVREYNYCHSACMLLDVVDLQTAVKANVPLSVYTAKRTYCCWTDFSEAFRGNIHVRKATWRDIAYRHQGPHEVHARGPTTEEKFCPFQIEEDGWICRRCYRLRLEDLRLGRDSVQENEMESGLVFDNGSDDWDEQEDAEAHQFDPYPSDEGLTMSDDTNESVDAP